MKDVTRENRDDETHAGYYRLGPSRTFSIPEEVSDLQTAIEVAYAQYISDKTAGQATHRPQARCEVLFDPRLRH